MKSIFLVFAALVALSLGGCAHLPNEDEKTALKSQQHELMQIEAVLYNSKDEAAGLFDQLKTCSMQLHDRVNPSATFQWSEKIERHPDKDFFSEKETEISFAEYQVLVERYKIFRQYAALKKENYKQRLVLCKADLQVAMANEKTRVEREQALLQSLQEAQLLRQPASVVAPAISPTSVPTPEKEETAAEEPELE